VSCETWNELASYADRLLREGSPERLSAERHFARCPSCAERAFLLDPSWAVNRTTRTSRRTNRWQRSESSEPSAPSDPPERTSFGSREIADLKRDVLEAGRIRAVEGAVHKRRAGMRVAIAAALLSVLVAGGALLRTIGPFRAAIAPESMATKAAGIAPAAEEEFFAVSEVALDLSLPTLGSLVPAAARVYDFGQEDFAFVMVVHETLDL